MKQFLINNSLSVLIIITAFLGVFLQAAWDLPRTLLGGPINLLPPLMVFAGLRTGVTTITVLAVLAGLWMDSLSANRVGVSMLPLVIVGLAIHRWRKLILQEFAYARFIIGLFASAAVPLLTLVVIMTLGESVSLGWGMMWYFAAMTLVGGLLTPLCFVGLDGIANWLVPRPVSQPSFRLDREIKRGRY